MLKKLISLLPVSRRKYLETLDNLTIVLDGIIESDSNHNQIEMSLINSLQQVGNKKSPGKSRAINKDDVAFM